MTTIKFCPSCGSKTVQERIFIRYHPLTGDPVYYISTRCAGEKRPWLQFYSTCVDAIMAAEHRLEDGYNE